MNRLDTEHKSASGSVAASTTNARLTGSWLIIARVLWLALVVPSLVLFVASLPVYYQQLQKACVDVTTCNLPGTLTAQGLQVLSTIGFSASGYAAFFTIFLVIIAVICSGVGFLIFWRRSDDWLALLAAFVLVIFGITAAANTAPALALASPLLALPLGLVGFLGYVSFGAFFLLFPNGRLVPRWTGLILLLFILDEFFNNFPSPASNFETNWPTWSYGLVFLVLFGSIIYSQIYRYRRVSTPVQRQQTKWIVFGITATVGIISGLFVISSLAELVPNYNNPITTLLFNEAWGIIVPIATLLLPLSFGFSIMRYRLYDIDVLTVLLALVYVGLVIGLQSLVRLFTGQAGQSPIVIVASTLAIAALFQPLRHRIQAIIDRRFYRRKYDAAKTVEAFSATLRNEVDLSQLSEQLLTVMQDTMQPAHVSLWLRKPDHDSKRHINLNEEKGL